MTVYKLLIYYEETLDTDELVEKFSFAAPRRVNLR